MSITGAASIGYEHQHVELQVQGFHSWIGHHYLLGMVFDTQKFP